MAIRRILLVSCFGAQGLFVLTEANAGPSCNAGQNYDAVDISKPINDRFLKTLKSIGVSTVIRYYDWENETLPGKTLTAAELNLIKRNHLSVAVVFQHHNDRRTTFETAGRGRTDARRSLYLAHAFNQHAGSAIYFGVDGVFQPNLVDRYFKEINYEFATNKANIGYSIGIYGSGRDCDQILSQRLAKYCWLANAKSWPGYDSLERSGRWSVKQFTPTKDCFGQEVDLNKVNLSRSRDFGQWRP
jgi:Domain of unknown function (DUF1906)